MTLNVVVHGVPTTQGSMKAYVRGGRAIITANNGAKLRPWREAVRATLVDALDGQPPMAGPVAVDLVFWLPKPASAPKRRRTWPIGARSGDLDKLARAAFDAATDAGVWVDDSQAVILSTSKDYDRGGFVGLHATFVALEVPVVGVEREAAPATGQHTA